MKKMKVVKSYDNTILTVPQKVVAVLFLPFYFLGIIVRTIWNIAINIPSYPNRMLGIIRIAVMLTMMFYEAGLFFDKHLNWLMHKFEFIGFSASTSETMAAFSTFLLIGNIVFQFIYVVIFGAATHMEADYGPSYNENGADTSSNGFGRMMRGLDYDLSMRNTKAGQKEVMREWFGGDK